MNILPSTPLLLAFLLASLILAVTPGPAVVYILTRTLSQGRASGLASVAGVALGNLGNAVGAALGLAALFAVSSVAFTVVKWAGAAYLVYVGVRMLRSAAGSLVATTPLPAMKRSRVFRDGFVVALLNPKTALFFAAFLPQFLSSDRPFLPQLLVMIATWTVLDLLCKLAYGLGAHGAARYLRSGNGQSWFNRTSAGLFGAAGVASLINR